MAEFDPTRDRIRIHTLNKGMEFPDPTPMSPPIGYKKQPTMVEMMQNMVRGELLRRYAEAEGMESFEEADDFDVDDENDPGDKRTIYETGDEAPLSVLKERAKAAREAVKQASLKEQENEARRNEGRTGDPDQRSRQSRAVSESDKQSQSKSSDEGSSRPVARGTPNSEG